MSSDIQQRLRYHPPPGQADSVEEGRRVEARAKAIRSHVDLSGATVLDLGCSGGYFTFSFAQESERVVGVDADRAVIQRNRRFASEHGFDNVEFVEGKISPEPLSTLPDVDVVLFLSVFHHILAASEAYAWNDGTGPQNARSVIEAVREKAGVLVFEMGMPDEGKDWCSDLPPMGSDPSKWIEREIFGDAYDRVIEIDAPARTDISGWARRRLSSFVAGAEGHEIHKRLLRKVIALDVRDNRPLFIGSRR
jgi:SAM-dependent methyltransferase